MGVASKGTVTLLSNASATGSGKRWPGGRSMFIVSATFGGGTVKLQTLAGDGTTWVDVASGSLTAAGTLTMDLPLGQYRANVATSTAVYATLAHCPD